LPGSRFRATTRSVCGSIAITWPSSGADTHTRPPAATIEHTAVTPVGIRACTRAPTDCSGGAARTTTGRLDDPRTRGLAPCAPQPTVAATTASAQTTADAERMIASSDVRVLILSDPGLLRYV
jgi:hypothetical protein